MTLIFVGSKVSMPSGFTDIKQHLAELFGEALNMVAPDQSGLSIELEQPKHAQHGDYACNLAMQLAKLLRRNPRDVAKQLLEALPDSRLVEKAEIAGAGFINLFLKPSAKQQVVQRILALGAQYGAANSGKEKKSRSNLFPPTRPGRCMSAMGAARRSVPASPMCSPQPVIKLRVNFM